MSHRHTRLQLEKRQSNKWLRSSLSIEFIPPGFPFSKEKLADFQEKIFGKVVFPWTPGYEDDRQEFDDLYPTYPLVIVYAVSFMDVRECLSFAHDANIQTAIRSSGHSLACYSVCEGIVIDLSQMKSIYVDLEYKTALIDSGANFSDFYPVVEQYNLHMPTGDCPTVCPSGYMMGGGFGITSRMYGMGCDNAVEVTVMLADGKIVVANKALNEDLFWAIRGGTGGNFGVLLKTKFRLYPLGLIYGVQIRWPVEKEPHTAAQVLYTIQEKFLQPGVYPQLGIETILSSNENGQKTLFFCATWIGDEASFQSAIQPLLNITGHTICSYKGKYSDVNSKVLDGTPEIPEDVMAFSRSTYLNRPLSQEDWFKIARFFYSNAPNQYTMIDMEAYGGNLSTIPENSNAFIHRNVTMDFFTEAFFDEKTNDRKKNEAWTSALFEFMKPYASSYSYQNYPFREQEDFRTAYWGKYYNQLVLIKQKYDPGNFFRYQQSIGPGLIDDPDQVMLFEPIPIQYETY